MKKLLVSIMLGFTLAFGGCSTFSVHDPVKVEEMSPLEKAQAGINQVKAAVASINKNAVVNRKLYNDIEWIELKAKLNEVKGHIDAAQEYVDLGTVSLAEGKMALVATAITLLKAELLKRAQ
jgi:hypothetical protein